jgi:hypothetical protein
MASAASAKATVVRIAQNFWLGGIQCGTAERAGRCGIGGGRSIKSERSAEDGKLFEEVRVGAVIGGRFDDGGNAGEDEAKIDRTQDGCRRAGGARDLDAQAATDLKAHEADGNDGAERTLEEMVKVLPGFGVVPKNPDDAEEDGGSAEKNAGCLHRQGNVRTGTGA